MIAFTQYSPLLIVDRQICQSNILKSSTAKTTPLEEMEPIVRCGYLYLNQAAIAPGQDPPIVIHGFLGVILYRPDFDILVRKQAKSLSACPAVSSLIFSRLKDFSPKGNDFPQNLCYKDTTRPPVCCAMRAVQEVLEIPLHSASPQMQRMIGPVEGTKQSSKTKYLCCQVASLWQLLWSTICENQYCCWPAYGYDFYPSICLL